MPGINQSGSTWIQSDYFMWLDFLRLPFSEPLSDLWPTNLDAKRDASSFASCTAYLALQNSYPHLNSLFSEGFLEESVPACYFLCLNLGW